MARGEGITFSPRDRRRRRGEPLPDLKPATLEARHRGTVRRRIEVLEEERQLRFDTDLLG